MIGVERSERSPFVNAIRKLARLDTGNCWIISFFSPKSALFVVFISFLGVLNFGCNWRFGKEGNYGIVEVLQSNFLMAQCEGF
jgi:hypothetical protein